MRIPPLSIKIVLESSPLKSIMLVQRLAVWAKDACATFRALITSRCITYPNKHELNSVKTIISRRGKSPTCITKAYMTFVKSTCIIARKHYSQLTSHEGALSRCALNQSWAIMDYHGIFLTTDYDMWFL